MANSLHIFSPPTSSPVKLMFISSVALCTALMLTDFSKTPHFLTLAVSLLKPPYIYGVINSIILTLILISKLQESFVFTRPATSKEGFLPAVDIQQPEFIYSYHANNVMGVEGDVVADGEPEEAEKESDTVLALLADKSEEMAGNSEMMVLPTESSLIPYHEKILDSGRVGDHPELQDVESVVEDTRAMVPSKLKEHSTREQIWKKLSESQTMPTTRQKKKPDTSKSKTCGNVHGHVQVMKKHETFRNRTPATFTKECCEQPKQLMWEDRSLWKLRKEPSLSQEELNVKVEAFINKFNEDMRLERQQSLNRYLDI